MPENILLEAVNLQQAYAAHVHSLRGWLPNSESVHAPRGEEHIQLALQRSEAGVAQIVAGKWFGVLGTFRTAPLFAYLDEQPLEMRSEVDLPSRAFTLELRASRTDASGVVRLVWPDRAISSKERVEVSQELPSILTLERCGGYLWKSGKLCVDVPEAPSLVRFGAVDIERSHWQWRAQELVIAFPSKLPPSQLVIITKSARFQSVEILDPADAHRPAETVKTLAS